MVAYRQFSMRSLLAYVLVISVSMGMICFGLDYSTGVYKAIPHNFAFCLHVFGFCLLAGTLGHLIGAVVSARIALSILIVGGLTLLAFFLTVVYTVVHWT